MNKKIPYGAIFRKTLAIDILFFLHNNKNQEVYTSLMSREFNIADVNVLTQINTLSKLKLITRSKSDKHKKVRLIKLTLAAEKLIPHLIEVDKILKELTK